jgi:hypothetical protein
MHYALCDETISVIAASALSSDVLALKTFLPTAALLPCAERPFGKSTSLHFRGATKANGRSDLPTLVATAAKCLASPADNSLPWVNPPDFAERLSMKSFDSRTYSINDFVEWDKNKQLELNPFFQRRPVWSDKAKSYLIDTILRGKPIPKIFIRQKINVTTKTSAREVVDGQQRLRTILSFIKDGFVVSRRHNPDYGAKRFSQLPEEVQAQVLSYEVAVDLLINLPDSEVLDIFGRLNSYAVVLNEQEKINASHFGPFKILADEIGRKYNEYWKTQRVLTANQILRMQEVNLVADLLIAMKEGIKSKKQIRKYYAQYEDEFDDDVSELQNRFDNIIGTIGKLYPEGLTSTEFTRPHLFYSLFTAVAHCLYGLPTLGIARPTLDPAARLEAARNGLDRVGNIFVTDIIEDRQLTKDEAQFLQDARRATTDEKVRERRTIFLVELMA